jgi:L-glyceraldehyde 3-phosphate reductase
MSALDAAVRAGKALYVGISSYSAQRTEAACDLLAARGTPLLVHQASYSLFNRWIEDDLLDVLGRRGIGCIGFSPLAQGLLTDRYLLGVPDGARATQGKSLDPARYLTAHNLERVRTLHVIARERGQSLAQLALAWALRDERMTSLVIGASSTAQLDQNLAALDRLDFTSDELNRIEPVAIDGDINIWARSSRA